jgi:hypothetical protein
MQAQCAWRQTSMRWMRVLQRKRPNGKALGKANNRKTAMHYLTNPIAKLMVDGSSFSAEPQNRYQKGKKIWKGRRLQRHAKGLAGFSLRDFSIVLQHARNKSIYESPNTGLHLSSCIWHHTIYETQLRGLLWIEEIFSIAFLFHTIHRQSRVFRKELIHHLHRAIQLCGLNVDLVC